MRLCVAEAVVTERCWCVPVEAEDCDVVGVPVRVVGVDGGDQLVDVGFGFGGGQGVDEGDESFDAEAFAGSQSKAFHQAVGVEGECTGRRQSEVGGGPVVQAGGDAQGDAV